MEKKQLQKVKRSLFRSPQDTLHEKRVKRIKENTLDGTKQDGIPKGKKIEFEPLCFSSQTSEVEGKKTALKTKGRDHRDWPAVKKDHEETDAGKREAALRRRHPRMARAASAGGSARHSDPEIEPQRVAPGWATTTFAPHIL